MSQAFRWVIRFCVILVSIAGAGSVNAGFIPILLDETNFQKAIPNTAVPGEFDMLELSSASGNTPQYTISSDPVTSRDIPEPSTLMFFGTGIIALAWSYRRGAAKLQQ